MDTEVRRIRGKKRRATIDFAVCDPEECDPDEGICRAAKACPHNVLEQEPFDQPMIFQNMCQACGTCEGACPLDAIEVKYGGRAI